MSKQRAHRKSNGTPFFFRYFLSIVLRVFLSTRFSRPNTKQGYPHTKHMSFWKVLPQRISLETSLLWDLSHTFEITSNVILTTAREEESLHIVIEQRFLVGLPASLGMTNKLHEIPPYPFEMTENEIPRIRSKRLSAVILNISKTSST